MQLDRNISLKELNTFGIDHAAEEFVRFGSAESLIQMIERGWLDRTNRLVLGGGSNILLTGDFQGIVIKNEILGIHKVDEDQESVYVEIGAGVNWHQFVMHCIAQGWAGVENLALIPGTMGAAPMQNIGAYGAEIREVFESLEAIEIVTGKRRKFSKEMCQFGYRESVFKTSVKGKYIITQVTLRLSKQPVFRVEYGAIQDTLKAKGVSKLSIAAVADAVIQIRQSKLPDPKQIGNAGSFFKNPTIPVAHFQDLKSRFADIPGYPVDDAGVKVPAAWLIDQCGWKGYREGAIGVHEKQALVLVNHGGASGNDLVRLSEKIRDSVLDRFGIRLQPEVNIIDGSENC